MALLTRLDLDAARALGALHGVSVASVESLAVGSVNSNFRVTAEDGHVYFARLYEEQGRAGALGELALLRALAGAGVPVATPLEPARGSEPEHAGKPFALFPWIEGEILCQARVTAEHCRNVGAALARVHLASSASAPLGAGRFGPSPLLERLERVDRSGRSELLADAKRVRALLERYRSERDPTLPSGLVHGDLFRDNVLWQNGRIAALLDFESAFEGPFLYDVLVTIAAWCYGAAFERELVRALVEGYAAARPFQANELAAVRVEGALACLRFAVTRLTDFSLRAAPGSPPLRDYRRFLERLAAIEAGALDDAFR